MATANVPGTNVELDTDTKQVINPLGSSFDQTAQALNVGETASEARDKGFSFVDDPNFKQPSVLKTDDVKENVNRAVTDIETIDESAKSLAQRANEAGIASPKSDSDVQRVKDELARIELEEGRSPTDIALQSANDSINQEIEAANTRIEDYRLGLDSRLQGTLNTIQQSYARRTRAMETFNKNQLAGKTIRGIRTGRQRFAPEMQTSILGAEESAGLTRIDDINQQMQAEMNSAQQAFQDNNFRLMTMHSENTQNLLAQKRQAVLDQADLASRREEEIRENAKFQIDINNYESEQNEKVAGDLASGLVDIDESGNLIEPTAEELQAFADEYGLDATALMGQVNTRIDELKGMDLEERKFSLDIMKATNSGLTTNLKEYNFAREQGYDSNFLTFLNAQNLQNSTNLPNLPTTVEELSPLARSVWNGTMSLNDLTPTAKATVGPELDAVGWSQVVTNEQKAEFTTIKKGMDDILGLWDKVPDGLKGFVQGRLAIGARAGEFNEDVAAFNAGVGIVGMQLTRLFEKGRISDMDRVFYMSLMPNLRMNSESALAGADQLKSRLDEKLRANVSEVNRFIVESTPSSSTLDDYYTNNPGEQQKIEKMIEQNPNITDEEILQVLGANFSRVDSDTNIAVKASSIPSNLNIKIGAGLAVPNNNPGNLRLAGQIGATQGKGGFARFSSPQAGFQALIGDLEAKKAPGGRLGPDSTLQELVFVFAPPSENASQQYVNQVASRLGISPNTPINQIDTFELAKEIAKKESSTIIG